MSGCLYPVGTTLTPSRVITIPFCVFKFVDMIALQNVKNFNRYESPRRELEIRPHTAVVYTGWCCSFHIKVSTISWQNEAHRIAKAVYARTG